MQLQQRQFDYSLKNIPIASKATYTKSFISKLESFIRRIRWKAFFLEHNNDENNEQKTETFGYKSELTPSQHQGLLALKKDLYKMARSIEFQNRPNSFQQKLIADVNSIRSSPKMLISTDKTNNLYEISTENYNKLLLENVTKSYKNAPETLENNINKEAKKIATDLNLAERIQKFTEKKNAFLTLKDHKDNFLRNTPCRLFNPAKTEIGKISKQYLDQINNAIRQTSRCNQWTNTAAVISWFENMFIKNISTLTRFFKIL